MARSTILVSLRLNAALLAKVKALANVAPNSSVSGVLERSIDAGLSLPSTVEAQVYLEAAVAKLAIVLAKLKAIGVLDDPQLVGLPDFYGELLELLFDITEVEQ